MTETKICVSSRNLTLDLLKGIAILNIVFIHTIFWSGSTYNANDTLRQLSLIVDVSLFFFLSGWAANYQKNNIKIFTARIFKLYVQYIVMIIFMVIMLIAVFGHNVSSLPIAGYLSIDTNSNSYELPVIFGSLWFLKVFFIVYLLTPLLVWVSKNKQNSLFLLFGLLCLISMSTFINNSIYNAPLFFTSLRYIIFYTFFYFAGIILYDNKITLRQCISYISGTLLIVSLYFVTSKETFNLQNNKFPPSLIYLLASIFSIVVALYAKNLEGFFKKCPRSVIVFLSFLGKNVYTVYLYQGFGASILFLIIPKVYPIINNWAYMLILCYTINLMITLCLTFIFVHVNKKIFEISDILFSKLIIGERGGTAGRLPPSGGG